MACRRRARIVHQPLLLLQGPSPYRAGGLTGGLTGGVAGGLAGGAAGNLIGGLTGGVEGGLIGGAAGNVTGGLIGGVAGIVIGRGSGGPPGAPGLLACTGVISSICTESVGISVFRPRFCGLLMRGPPGLRNRTWPANVPIETPTSDLTPRSRRCLTLPRNDLLFKFDIPGEDTQVY